jgi:glucose-6-phosphate 1-dehydrogenase
MAPYERLIGDAMEGNRELFTSEQASELAWRIFDPVLGDRPPPLPYAPGSWGPPAALAALSPPGGWVDPLDGGSDLTG